jgi:hypothetical protein
LLVLLHVLDAEPQQLTAGTEMAKLPFARQIADVPL